MIKCEGCPIDAIHESDEERLKCVCRERCERAYQQGRADRETEIIHIIEQMRESASAMMWTEREVACEKILEQIRSRNE